MTNRPSADDVWYARNQPYGYWRVGNPIVKACAVLLMSIGLVAQQASLVFQCSLLIWIMLWMPFRPTSKTMIVLIHLGLGGILVGLFAPSMLVDYGALDIKIPIQQVGSLKVLETLYIFFGVFSFVFASRAVTSRDYAWLITVFPRSMKTETTGYIFSYAYALVRLPSVLGEVNISILSRGLRLPLSLFPVSNRLDSFGIWTLAVYREMNEMASTIEYQIVSKLKPETRTTPVGKYFSTTDASVLGIILASIVLPRILLLFK